MRGFGYELVKRFLILWFPFFMAAPVFAQGGGSNELTPPSEEPAAPTAPPPVGTPPPAAPVNPVQNAVLEGVQISSEPSKEEKENVVTCYFIFRDKPSSYFYEVKRKTNKLVFEFNDTQKGNSPVASQKVPPIDGFVLEQGKIDVNKEVRGLNPEWHDMVTVTFDLSAIPKINVTDEYNVISFNFKWSTDPAKIKALTDQKEKSNPGLIAGVTGGVVVAGGIAGYFIWKAMGNRNGGGLTDLDTNDLPVHQPKMW
jgi:hypothetical protein